MSELEKFEEAPEGIDIELPTGGKDDGPGHSFSAGDNVEVCEGELMNLQGKILAIDGHLITIMPKHEDLHVSLPDDFILLNVQIWTIEQNISTMSWYALFNVKVKISKIYLNDSGNLSAQAIWG